MKSPYIHCHASSFRVYNEEQHNVQKVLIWALSDALGPDVLFQFELGKNTYSGRYPFSIPVVPVHF